MEKVNLKKDPMYHFGDELNFNQKLRVVDELSKENVRLDFSGGEVLIDPLNLEVILYASEKLGPENVGISVTGAFLDIKTIERLKGKIKDVELTLDYLPFINYSLRPSGYHESTANVLQLLKKNDFRVGIETVLTKENMEKQKVKEFYEWLVNEGIDEWSLLRFFPSGRGKAFKQLTPSYKEYIEIVEFIKKMNKDNRLNIHFQYLLPNHSGYTLDCRAVKKSIGILPNGKVVGCFWALNEQMQPLNDDFILGKLPEQTLNEILTSKNSKKWIENNNKCIFFNYDMLEKD